MGISYDSCVHTREKFQHKQSFVLAQHKQHVQKQLFVQVELFTCAIHVFYAANVYTAEATAIEQCTAVTRRAESPNQASVTLGAWRRV